MVYYSILQYTTVYSVYTVYYSILQYIMLYYTIHVCSKLHMDHWDVTTSVHVVTHSRSPASRRWAILKTLASNWRLQLVTSITCSQCRLRTSCRNTGGKSGRREQTMAAGQIMVEYSDNKPGFTSLTAKITRVVQDIPSSMQAKYTS